MENFILDNLPDRAKKIYEITLKNASNLGYDLDFSKSVAELAVKSNYKQIEGIWYPKSVLSYNTFDMYITKVSYRDGKMLWHSTASDTSLDSFGERMSIDLYQSFIKNMDGHEYLSLAHYPSLDGSAELGKVDVLYIDGNKLKSKGTFYNNEIGIAAYNAIRKDRRENTPNEKRIRISIGFWDYAHKHENKGVWSYKSGVPCLLCSLNVKDKVYLEGKLDHLALTRIPALKSTSIEVE